MSTSICFAINVIYFLTFTLVNTQLFPQNQNQPYDYYTRNGGQYGGSSKRVFPSTYNNDNKYPGYNTNTGYNQGNYPGYNNQGNYPGYNLPAYNPGTFPGGYNPADPNFDRRNNQDPNHRYVSIVSCLYTVGTL